MATPNKLCGRNHDIPAIPDSRMVLGNKPAVISVGITNVKNQMLIPKTIPTKLASLFARFQ